MGTKTVKKKVAAMQDLAEENKRLRKDLDHIRFVAIDMLEKLEAIERELRDILVGKR